MKGEQLELIKVCESEWWALDLVEVVGRSAVDISEHCRGSMVDRISCKKRLREKESVSVRFLALSFGRVALV